MESQEALNFLNYTHLYICEPFDVNSFNKERYFITFIDDFSRYGYVYLLHEKLQAVNVLEVYINELEMKLDRKVKIVRSDRVGEYYGKYDESTIPKFKRVRQHQV